MKYRYLPILISVLGVACQPPPQAPAATARAAAELDAVAETTPTVSDGANDPAIAVDRADPSASLVLGSGLEGGLEVYGLDGRRISILETNPISLVDLHYGFPLAGDTVTLVVAYDVAAAALHAYKLDGQELIPVSADPIPMNAELEGLCLYRSPRTGNFYAIAVGDGRIQQWELYDDNGNVAASRVRVVPVGHGAGHCAVSNRNGMIYYSQETIGVWQLPAEPEAEAVPEPVAYLEPHGPFIGDVKGVGIYEHPDGALLIVSDADASRFQLFDLDDNSHVGTFSVAGVEETEGIAVAGVALTPAFKDGLVVVADDMNDGENTNYKMISWTDIAAGLDLDVAGGIDPTTAPGIEMANVTATVETVPVLSYGDAADDPAIWIHPTEADKSLVIGAQKKTRALNVYDLDGFLLQSLPDGRINNVDIRYGFELGGETVDIVAGSNRSTDSLSFWRIHAESRTLENVTDGVVPTGMMDPYGLCLYRSSTSGQYYVFVNDTDGVVKQFLIEDRGNGRIGASVVREFAVGSQTEGCVADDATGDLYIGEEGVAIWKYGAEPDSGDDREMVDSIEGGNLDGDIEGACDLSR